MKTFTENEPTSPINARYPVTRVLYRGKSKYQKILVFESPFHGRVLALDDIVQLTTREEHFYHELLVHPILQAHPQPRNVLIIGGGDGGAAREAVKYPALEKIVQCELDAQVVAVARKFFRAWRRATRIDASNCVSRMAKHSCALAAHCGTRLFWI